MPAYQTEGAAGFDIAAYLKEPFLLKAGARALIPTGLFFEVPGGYEVQIRARSGLAIRSGIGLVNGIGTIDSDYRGEIKIPLINWDSHDFVIHDGDRIAQAVLSHYERADLQLSEELSRTERDDGGFGHTGL